MKKPFVFLICSILLLPCFLFCSFAEDRFIDPSSLGGGSLRSVPDSPSGYPYSYTFKDVITPLDVVLSVSFESNGQSFTSIGIGSDNKLFYYSGAYVRVYDYNTDTWIDDSYRYLTFTAKPNSISWLNDNEYFSVSPQVGASLNFIGQVVSFVTSNGFTLAIIGLSIGVFLILPFSIRKFKQFVKGY